jgi:anti-sigma factor RsiW
MNQIDNQKLIDYLNGKLTAEEQHEVEKWMMENPFDAEALEGLQQGGSGKNVQATVDQLNRQLHQYLEQKKQRRKRKPDPTSYWTYIAILFILILAILAYLIIRKSSLNP